ncbi:MAG: prepilin-type N-terminal cleavage/methylation domain-containing protein [Alphaproteobacteria bacterium]
MPENKRFLTKNNQAFSLIELSIVILIIGILVAGVTQSSRLINAMKLKSARSQTLGSPVPSIANLVMWLEPTMEQSFDANEASDGAEITTWFDINLQSTLKNNAISSGSQRPRFTNNCLNGLPCVKFDGNDYLDTTQQIGGLKASIFLVISASNVSAGGCCAVLINASSTWMLGKVHYQLDGTANLSSPTGVASYLGNSSALHYANRNGVLANIPYIYSVVDRGTSVELYINGATSGAGTTAGNPSGMVKIPTTHNIASWFDGTNRSRYLNGYIAEIIFYDRDLKNDERIDVEKYLARKWAIKI